ncbi:hypothetical protein [Acidiphilium sp.]|uniref:hypothetical protein n=1 Tax=Acidiphilium sp. TaxID=527 RepID=UPI00258ABEF3|nr:hypothetical protein [Acidiphilium sp.]
MVGDGFDRAPLDSLLRAEPPDPMVLASALADAAAAIARLDQALAGHPLAQAFLYRVRLEAVRRMAAVDGQLIDPWHLAATIEGLRLRMDPYLRIIDRGEILERARAALTLHQWLVEPDFDQEGEVQRAAAMLAMQPASLPPLIAAAQGFREWIEMGETRPAMRAAMIRFWRQRRLLGLPVPLTGAAALRSDQSWDHDDWLPAFLRALAREAADGLDLLYTMERGWFEARRGIAGRRKDSHVAPVVDLLAAAPVLSATTLARILGIAVKNAIRILDELVAAEIAIEVTHRSKRRLFGLKGLAPLREVVRPPYRPDPNRGPGRPRQPSEAEAADIAPLPLPPLTPIERRAFDYTALEEAMAHLDAVVRQTRAVLKTVAAGTPVAGTEATAKDLDFRAIID